MADPQPFFKNPQFLNDEGCVERTAFAHFLRLLRTTFIPLSEVDEDVIVLHVQDICEHAYQEAQLRRSYTLADKGLWIDPPTEEEEKQLR